MVGRVVVVATEEGVLRGGLRTLGAFLVIVVLLLTALHVHVFKVEALVRWNGDLVPRCLVIVPGIVLRLLPRVEWARQGRLVAIPPVGETCAYLRVHEEWGAAALGLGGLGSSMQLWQEMLVERQARDMATGINAEAIDTHIDKLRVAVDQVVGHMRVLRIQVYAVSGNLRPPACLVVPIEVAEMVIQVMAVVVLAVCVLHHGQTLLVLTARREAPKAGTTHHLSWLQGTLDAGLIMDLLVAVEHGAKGSLAEVAAMV